MEDTFHPLAKLPDSYNDRDPDNQQVLPSCLPNQSHSRRFSTSALPADADQKLPSKRASDEFVRRVSFDTMTHQDMPDYSFTLQEKSHGWERTISSRVFMLATDLESHSNEALKYAVEVKFQTAHDDGISVVRRFDCPLPIQELLEDGDEIVVVRVADVQVNRNILGSSRQNLQEHAVLARQHAEQLLQRIKESHGGIKISIVLEFVIGRTQTCLRDMLQMYHPSALIVGTQGKPSSLKTMFPGNSISQFCLRLSPVPVIVVKESSESSRRSSSNSSNENNDSSTASKWIRKLSLNNRSSKSSQH
ncbi:hypothetical protein INT44_001707 [Umbelopsis vinacea]|uniref:UspA domain-containing protein n=1 Tax=Umbelopsis vinacea TaxID=44442 RepID=A0A8H7UGN7_9FUNG|nr:hypothetical protein INT44_001707 [Umbelopsis vinacea]